MDRRSFIAAGFGFGVAAVSRGADLFTGARADFDDSLTVFLSDVHVCGAPFDRWVYTRDEFARRVAAILAMRPLPRRVVVFGDIAFGGGDIRDYRVAKPQFDLLKAAGIRVVLGTGNHDRRNTMLEVFPDCAKDSPVPGRIVSVVDLGSADLVLLDSLRGEDGRYDGPVDGALDAAQQEWLADFLPRCTRPVLVGAHHEARELSVKGRPIVSLLKRSPTCAGWIHGHNHVWKKTGLYGWGDANEDVIRSLTLPSGGLWGDIGYVTFRTSADGARADLVQLDHWFNDRYRKGEARPAVDQAILDENRGQYCLFPYARALRHARPC